MADNHNTTEISPYMDYQQHEKTWNLFTQLVKWGIIGCAVLVVFLYIAINP
jgi:hypothetical protein